MNCVSLLAQHHPRESQPRRPQVAHCTAAAQPHDAPDHQHVKKHQPHFVRTLPPEIHHRRRHRHCQRRPAHRPLGKVFAKREQQSDRKHAHHHDWQTHCENRPPKKFLRNPRQIEGQGTMVICRVIRVVAALGDLLRHESDHAFVMVRWLQIEPRKPKERCDEQDGQRHPLAGSRLLGLRGNGFRADGRAKSHHGSPGSFSRTGAPAR